MNSKNSDRVIYDRRTPRWMNFVAFIAAGALTAAFVYFVFLKEDADFDLAGKIGFGFASVVSGSLALLSLYRIVRDPPYFVMYEDGFEYSPGGVSTGLIKWTDVRELRDESVLNSKVGTPARLPVTAVVLRNPDEYVRRFPSALRPLFELRMKMNSSPILISRGEFGGDQPAIIAIMREQVAKANQGKGSGH